MKKLLLMSACLALAACGGGGKSYAEHDVGVCPSTARCLLEPGGEHRVTLEGTVATNLSYECGRALYYVLDTATEQLPANQALCPSNAESIAFFLGDRRYEGRWVTLGEAYLPQRLTTRDYRFTLADMVEAPRRIDAGDYRVRNRAALLMALDSDPATSRLELPEVVNELVSEHFDALVPALEFDYPDYAAFRTAWQPLLGAVSAEVPVSGFPADPSTVTARISNANRATRAGEYALETCQDGAAPCDQPEAFDTNQSALRMEALVLPDGRVLGLGQLQKGDPDNGGGEDLVTWEGVPTLTAGLTFQQGHIVGLLNSSAASTDATLTGRLLGHRALYINQRVAGGFVTDFALDLPGSPSAPGGGEAGRVQGSVLGSGNLGLSVRATQTGPMMVNGDGASVAAGYYSVTLKRACTGSSEQCSDFIPTKELGSNGNYPACLHDSSGGCRTLEPNQARERNRADENQIETFVVRISADGAAYAAASCEDEVVPAGLVTAASQSRATVTLLLAPGAANKAGTPHFGTRIDGTLDLTSGNRPLYRTDRYSERLRGIWRDLYRPAQLRAAGSDDLERQDSESRGSVEWRYQGSSCAL
ncbi:hypothetical protein B5T_02364 [Alloalcanivorax dieselolei B5]|uniref:Lipoprotein n=1 Tax=Alcanivorax dieselolei (strain DSM 16502 / CGMCC 1.3690 / MCCC 1A00001 / B-5) TaxID=930169 RepID=K0CDI2_ALCDB|nr:hypothetical protein [Alloalcanivorax dieselolei]AFT70638.1 hypothetical protein B5T_02364 [Alloalcanivorax dieselolei B5]GGJ85842.1 hypothetical protein GCM10007426_13730 [Alloalcanivorax dieselolei]